MGLRRVRPSCEGRIRKPLEPLQPRSSAPAITTAPKQAARATTGRASMPAAGSGATGLFGHPWLGCPGERRRSRERRRAKCRAHTISTGRRLLRRSEELPRPGMPSSGRTIAKGSCAYHASLDCFLMFTRRIHELRYVATWANNTAEDLLRNNAFQGSLRNNCGNRMETGDKIAGPTGRRKVTRRAEARRQAGRPAPQWLRSGLSTVSLVFLAGIARSVITLPA